MNLARGYDERAVRPLLSLLIVPLVCSCFDHEHTFSVVVTDDSVVATVEAPVDVATRLVDLASERTEQANDVSMRHGNRYLPFAASYEVVGFSRPWNPAPPAGKDVEPPAAGETEAMAARRAEWLRTAANLEDYDFMGVSVTLAPDRRGVRVESRRGDPGGVKRVVAWLRARARELCS